MERRREGDKEIRRKGEKEIEREGKRVRGRGYKADSRRPSGFDIHEFDPTGAFAASQQLQSLLQRPAKREEKSFFSANFR